MDAPKRHKVSVHVLSREMDSCEYCTSDGEFLGDISSVVCQCECVALTVFNSCLNVSVLCLGPVVGEFPAQNDVNLVPAPSLPQVM